MPTISNNALVQHSYCKTACLLCLLLLLPCLLFKPTRAMAAPTLLIASAPATATPPPNTNSASQPLTAAANSTNPNITTTNPNDPYQGYNRVVFKMNSAVDKAVVRPVAVWYVTYTPPPLQAAINNFYNNLRDFVTLGNDLLQLNGMSSMQGLMRIAINSVFGIAGFIDVSSSLGLMQHKNSFGNTLKFYGWKNSSYIVIPLLGPSTIRDTIGMFPDIYFNPTWYILPNKDSDILPISLFVVDAIDTRAQFLGIDQVLQTSLDPYSTTRDFYLQHIGASTPHHNDASAPSIEELLNESSTYYPSDYESSPHS